MESKRCPVCSVETGSKIFAIMNSIAVGLASVGSISWVLGESMSILRRDARVGGERLLESIMVGVALLVSSLTFIAFAFSVVLAQGVFKRKPEYVKAYFIYGAVVVSLCVCFASGITLFLWSAEVNHEVLSVATTMALSVIGVCIVYSAILRMIWATYKKFLREDQYEHHILDEKKY